MPAQTLESVRFIFSFSVAGVPTSGLSPAPTVTIYSPAGVALVTGAALTEQATPARYIYDYTLPGVAGLYTARAFSSQANLDAQYVECALEVGQAWIQDLDAAISSRSTYAGGAVASVTGNVGGSVGSLAAQAQADVQSALTTQGYTTARAGYMDVLNGLLAAIWTYATRVLTAGTNIVLAKGVGVTGFNDLSAAQVNAEADTALSDAGVSAIVMAHLDADISSRLASGSYTTPPSAAAIRSEIDTNSAQLQTIVTNEGTINSNVLTRLPTSSYIVPLDAAGVRTALGLASANLDSQFDSIPLADDNAAAVWEHIIEGAIDAEEFMRAIGAALAGKVSGAGTGTLVFRNISDTKPVITATVTPGGNRLSITLDLT